MTQLFISRFPTSLSTICYSTSIDELFYFILMKHHLNKLTLKI